MKSDCFGFYQILSGLENTGVCWWCGGQFKDKRPRRYCCSECAEAYNMHFAWRTASWWALQRSHYRCQRCGIGKKGLPVRWEISQLEVHHKEPLNGEPRNMTAKNIPANLIVLCHECHQAAHAELRAAAKPQIVSFQKCLWDRIVEEGRHQQ